jgi:Uncharacterised nucleotidyltransferase
MPEPHSQSACVEKELLVLCARTRVPAPLAGRIRQIAAQPLDWDYVLCEAAENSITPLLDRNLRAFAADGTPPHVRDKLNGLCRANAVRSLLFTSELVRVLDVFRAVGIHAVPYKGPVAAVQAYGDLTLREFEDLDLILAQRDMPRADQAMRGLGYAPKFDWILSSDAAASLVPGEYNYRDGARGAMIELHTERTLRHFPVTPDIDELRRKLARIELGGHEMFTFAPEDALVMLAIHGSKDFWERFSWIADISELLQAYPSLDWDAAIRRAESLRAGRMLHVALALAAELLDAPLPETVSRRVRSDCMAAELASEVARRLLSRELPPLDAAGRFQFRRRMLEGKLAGWRYATRLTIVPAEEDWLMVRLPPSLAPLYVALRPLRLLRKYGWAGRSGGDSIDKRPGTVRG